MSDLKIIIGNKRYSSWSLRGWLALRHTGLPFEEVILSLDTPQFYKEIVRYSPAKRVPTLVHGDIPVWDSAAIIDYCAHLAPEKNWWPTEPAAYGHARSIFNEMHSGFSEIRTHMPMNLLDRWQDLTLSQALEVEVKRVETLWTECREKHGAGGDFLFGEYSAVDMMFAPVTSRFSTYGIEVNQTATAYIEAIRNQPDVADWFAGASKETEIVPMDQLADDITHLG